MDRSRLVLASSSPRRRAMFDMLMLDYICSSPDIDERIGKDILPEEAVKIISARKASEASEDFSENDFVISADTVVSKDGKIFGKPRDSEEAVRFLKILSGSCHEVYSGFTVIHKGKIYSESVCTKVYFRKLSDIEIQKYVSTGAPLDKAGAYGIQEYAGLFVEKIIGDLNNVIGLPLSALEEAMKREFSKSLLDFSK